MGENVLEQYMNIYVDLAWQLNIVRCSDIISNKEV